MRTGTIMYNPNAYYNSGEKPAAVGSSIKLIPSDLQTTTGYTLRASSSIINVNSECVNKYGGVGTLTPGEGCCLSACGAYCGATDCASSGNECCIADFAERVCGIDVIPCLFSP